MSSKCDFINISPDAGNDGCRNLPSFFVIGPPRTGTSWLHDILSQRAFLSSPTKETRFFDQHFHRGVEWYRTHYMHSKQDTTGRRIGEIAPTYFASSDARNRIGQMIPDAKVVCTFRNPVDRVFSLYRLKRAYGLIPWSFDQALERDPELMESSRYAANLKDWQRALGKDQVLATVYDDLRHDPQSYLDALVDFVGVPRFKLAPSQVRYVFASGKMTVPRSYYLTRGAALVAEWSKARQLGAVVAAAKKFGLPRLFVGGGGNITKITPAQSLRLYKHFRPEVEKLESMLNRDLSSWKYPEACEAEPIGA